MSKNFMSDIRNFSELPENGVWISIQHGKADYYRNHSPFAERSAVLVFPNDETPKHFIENWDSVTMSDYRQACHKADYKFYVILKGVASYFADDIWMSKDYDPKGLF